MQLQLTANSLTLNTNESLSTADRNRTAVTGTLLSSSQASAETLQASPVSKPVQPPGADASINSSTEEQSLGRNQSKQSTDTDSQVKEQQLIRELAARDQEVRQHELSHAAVGGQYAGAPTFDFERGPDGRLYAVGGEVSIDTSPVPNDPEATLEKAEVILRAALAVAEPSSQDRAIAVRAAAMASEARAEMAQQKIESGENAAGSQREADQLRENRRSEELQNRIKDQQDKDETQAEKREDFNEKMDAVNQKFAEINLRLIDAGVFKKLFNEGFIFDEIV